MIRLRELCREVERNAERRAVVRRIIEGVRAFEAKPGRRGISR